MKSALESLREALDDPEFINRMVNHFKEKTEKRKINSDRMRKFFSDDESFGDLLMRVIGKHGDRWTDLCYKNNVMPHPWNILYSLCDIVEDEGTEVDPVDGLTENFSSNLIEYRGWIFAWTHGQGTVLSIYDRNKELIYRD